jgi:transcriptional regulator with XRE-family HTH domain
MSEQPYSAEIPEWDLADRMRKSLRTAGVSVQDIASYLDVTPRSVGNWINGRIDPSTQTLRLWALRCGVPYIWLMTGDPNARGDARSRITPDFIYRGLRLAAGQLTRGSLRLAA